MARSLPVSVPLPEGLPKRGEIFDLPSDEEGDEDSDIDTEGKYLCFCYLVLSIFNQLLVLNCVESQNHLYFTGYPTSRRKSAIPEKIAQIAKSMYDRDNLGFGDLPRGNKPRKY